MPTFICYTFRDPEHLARLCARLQPHPVFVHVDAKVNIAAFGRALHGQEERVFMLKDRVVVNWAGYSQVEAIRRLVRAALAITDSDDYIVMLSGSDYPMKPMESLTEMMNQSNATEFIRAFRVAESSPQYRSQIERRAHYDLRVLSRGAIKSRAHARTRKALIRSANLLTRPLPRLKAPASLEIVHGGTHFALTARCLRDCESRVTPEYERFFSRIFCPEEKFYHTLVANSEFRSRMSTGGVEVYQGPGQWRYSNLHHIHATLVKVYQIHDWQEVASSDRYFLRKLDSVASATLLDRIDDALLGIEPGTTPRTE